MIVYKIYNNFLKCIECLAKFYVCVIVVFVSNNPQLLPFDLAFIASIVIYMWLYDCIHYIYNIFYDYSTLLKYPNRVPIHIIR